MVDQSEALDDRLAAPDLELVWDRGGRGLSRARNLAWPRVRSEWVVFIDDDCIVAPDWAARLTEVVSAHPEAAFISGHVGEDTPAENDGLVVSSFPVSEERVRSGARTWPWEIGFGVCMVLSRTWIERLGGWDERMGAGVVDIPAAEDMDFNYRLLKAGGIAVASPRLRATHAQWRRREDLPRLFGGYAIGWAAFAIKHVRLGDLRGGGRLWAWGAYGGAKMVGSAVRRRSRLRLRVAIALLRGQAIGTLRGLRRSWGSPAGPAQDDRRP